jgi:hypothetical protein
MQRLRASNIQNGIGIPQPVVECINTLKESDDVCLTLPCVSFSFILVMHTFVVLLFSD